MFMVINKSKIMSYIVVFSSVLVLLFTVSIMQSKNAITQSNAEKLAPASGKPTTEGVINSLDTKEKKVALTINCENTVDDLDSILSVLNKCNIKITFFVVGEWVEKNPEAIKKITANGHEIGNGSYSYIHINKLNEKDIKSDIMKCNKLVKALTGQDTKLYRAPYGEYNNVVVKSAKDLNHIPIKWSIDTLDYQGLDGDQIWDRLSNNISNGSIILMHNGTEHTVESLEMIIKKIQDKEYDIVTVSDLVYDEQGVQKKK